MKYIVLVIVTCALFVLDCVWGKEPIMWSEILEGGTFSHEIIMNFRLPRAVTSILVGISLSVSGLLMQTIFRNPLAGPYILGVSSGGSLGVAIFMLSGGSVAISWLASVGVVSSAWIGAAVVLLIVMAISVRIKDIMAILILGMMIGSVASAIVGLLQIFSTDSALKGFVIWSMGSLGSSSWAEILVMFFCVLGGLGITVCKIKSLDLLLLGENYARTLGLRVTQTRALIFLATAILAGGITAFCGPIAFVGIVAPHIARMIFKEASHRVLVVGSSLVGMAMMLLCDVISNMPLFVSVLPINSIASMLGIPIVIMVVVGSRKSKIM